MRLRLLCKLGRIRIWGGKQSQVTQAGTKLKPLCKVQRAWGSNRFRYDGAYGEKVVARKRAKALRKQGKLVHVTKEEVDCNGWWVVWVH